jgi:hypothetical protein
MRITYALCRAEDKRHVCSVAGDSSDPAGAGRPRASRLDPESLPDAQIIAFIIMPTPEFSCPDLADRPATPRCMDSFHGDASRGEINLRCQRGEQATS